MEAVLEREWRITAATKRFRSKICDGEICNENPWKYLRIFLKTQNLRKLLLSVKSEGKSLEISADFFPQQNPQEISKFLVV
jgi:hypothetical protein